MSARFAAPPLYTIPRSPRRCLRLETDLCPKVPADFGQAWMESIMEEYGWPEEMDDTIPASTAERIRREREEDEALYEEHLALEDMIWEEEMAWRDYPDEPFDLDPIDDEPDWTDYDWDPDYYDDHFDY